jgi:signal transduction histidine kinase
MIDSPLSSHLLPMINILQWLSGLILFSIAAYCHTLRQSLAARSLMFFCLLAGSWSFLSAIIFFQTNLDIAIALNRFKLVCVSLLAPSILWMIMSIVWQKKVPAWLMVALGLTPLSVLLLNLGPWYELYLGQYEFIKTSNYQILIFKDGFYFQFQNVISRILIVISMIIIFLRPYENSKLGSLDRLSLFLSLLIPGLIDTLAVFYFPVLRFMQLTPAFFIITAGLIAKIVFKDKMLDVIPYARSLIIESSNDLILVFNKNKKLVDFNLKAQKTFQLTDRFFSLYQAGLIEQRPLLDQDKMIIDSIVYERSIESLFDENNEKLGEIFIFKDTTLERALQSELEDINNTKTKLLGILGHDLQGHLGVISILTEDLIENSNEMNDQDVSGQLEAIHSSTRTSIEFVDELIRWTKADIGSLKVQSMSINLSGLADEIYEFMMILFSARAIEFECNIPKEMVIQSDPNLIKIIVRNLLSNAIKFSTESSTVSLTATEDLNCFEISIKDRGEGLDQDEIDSLLALKDSQRSGFGLLASINFAKRLGGEIFARGSKGEGCVFGLRIPKAMEHEEHKSIDPHRSLS